MEQSQCVRFAETTSGPLQMDLYLPVGCKKFPLLIFFHGGGLEGGHKEDLRQMGLSLVARGIGLAAPDYRLFPQAAYPAFIQDAAKAVGWVKNHRDELGAGALFVGGHSAGAYLSMMLCFDGTYLAQEGINPREIDGYLHASGQPTTHFNVLRYRGQDSRQVVIDEAAPIYHISEQGPPMLIVMAENDMENRKEQNELLLSTLKHFRYENQVDFHLFAGENHGSYFDAQEGREIPFVPVAAEFIQRWCDEGRRGKGS